MEQENTKVLSLIDLWKIFKRSLLWMILAAVLAGGIGVAYKKMTYSPVYTSNSTVSILRTEDDLAMNEIMSPPGTEMQYAMLILPTCLELIRLDPIFEKVAAELNAESSSVSYSAGGLRAMISVYHISNTNLIRFNATAGTAAEAKRILEAYTKHAREEILESFGATNLVQIEAMPSTPKGPSNQPLSMPVFSLTFLAAAAVYLIFFLLEFYNDRIASAEDIKQTSGLPVLGVIPNTRSFGKRYGAVYGQHYPAYGMHGAASKNNSKKGN
jgi:capsular polysaccharide biosynthesis protein